MIYTVEQFHRDHFTEVAATYSHGAAKITVKHLREQAPELPCRITAKPEDESTVWQAEQKELANRKRYTAAIRQLEQHHKRKDNRMA